MQLLLIACSLAGMIICGVTWGQNRPAPPADDLRGAPGKPGWAVDDRSGCWLWNANPQLGETVTWSSGCGPDGRANGRGILEWRSDGKTERYEGEVANGRSNGRGVYTWANGNRGEGEFRDGKLDGRGIWTSANGNRYEGEFRDGQPHGRGDFTWALGTRYEGEWRAGKQNGRGIWTSADGYRYEGEFRDGKPNGHGVTTVSNGNRHDGEVRNGNPNGRGVFTWANGERYDGEWRDGKQNGRGIWTSAQGHRYEGEWKDGSKNGGVETDADGGRYEGEFRDNKFNGRGVYTSAGGGRYEGEFRDGIPIPGRGILTSADGTRYEGEFDGKMNGRGVVTYADGSRYDGDLRDGNPNGRGIGTSAGGDRYEGEWKDGKRNGRGVFAWANGNRYEAEFKDNEMHGRGVATYADGTRYEGEFRDGKRHGRGVFAWANGNRFEVEFRDDKVNGRGVATHADGTRFDGEFRDGKFTGPTTELAFWTNALAKPVEQRIDVGPPELVTHIALDNIRNGLPNRPRTAQPSAEFLTDVRGAFAELPDTVKRQAAAKLAGIYVIENIGGTGYVGQAYGADGKPKVGFIILDPVVLAKQTANGWATWKENTPFKPDSAMRLEARIALDADDNRKNAIQYVLLHELAHVLSVGEAFHPNWSLNVASIPSTSEFPFFELSWKIDRGAERYVTLFEDAFPQRRDVVYYFGAKLPASEMPAVYERLGATNFSTLYAVTQPGDDFAEAFASYVHAEMMKKPFEIRILRDGKVARTYGSCWNLERCAAKRRILERFLEAR